MSEQDDRIADILETLSKRTESRPVLTIEKIVAAVIMLIVLTACGWVGSTVSTNTKTTVALQLELKHMNVTVQELKTELSKMRTDQRDIGLIMERMKADDDRERRDTATLSDHERRISALEKGGG